MCHNMLSHVLDVCAAVDEEEGDRTSKGGKARKRKGRNKQGDEEEEHQAAAAAAAAAATSGWSVFAKKAHRTLFGWMTSRIKVSRC